MDIGVIYFFNKIYSFYYGLVIILVIGDLVMKKIYIVL